MLPPEPLHLVAGSAFVGAALGLLQGTGSSRPDPGPPTVHRQALDEDDDRR